MPNRRAIESIVKAGLATNCEIQKHSMFYRKHYFYPDMAKNFQTTQGPVAFCMHGRLDLEVSGRGAAERPECAFGENEAKSLASASANAVGLSRQMADGLPEGAEVSDAALGGMGSYDTAGLAVPERRADGSYSVPIRILRIHMEEDAAKMVHVGGAEGRIGGAAESLVDYNRCGTPLIELVPIRILRIHMEEDAAKMVHVGGAEGRIGGAAESLVDYNRCGTPLIELVTEPDLRTPEEARLFMEKLRRIFLTIGISDCSMEKGSMRCDGNVSLRRRGETGLGTKTELKNLNSFKALHDGLAYEICRQAEVLESGGTIYQETRHWEPSRKRTVVMRVKETADDYRLFPDPDLEPFDLSDEFVEHCRAELPELPDAKRDRIEREFGVKRADAEQLAGDPVTASFFEEAAAGLSGKAAQTVANLVVNELAAYLKAFGVALGESGIAPAQVASLAKLLASDAISSNQAHEVFEAMAASGDDPEKIVDERGMRQVSDAGALQPIVDEVLAACAALQPIVVEVLAGCADQAQQYRVGNQKVIGFLVGQCMKASRGKGNPKLFNELLRASLS